MKRKRKAKVCSKICEYVPYQICPICKGLGGYHNSVTSSILSFINCTVCSGNKVIPMFKVN